MTELLAGVLTTSQLPTADLETDVLGLKVLVGCFLLPPPFHGLLLSGAAVLAALMPATVELSLADSEAQGCLDRALMTSRSKRRPAASASHVDGLATERARSGVARVLAQVPARELLVTRLLAVRNWVLTRLPGLCQNLPQRGLSAWAVRDNIRREGAMRRVLVLRMARFLASMLLAVERPAARTLAAECAFKPIIPFLVLLCHGRLELPIVEGFKNVVSLVALDFPLFLPAVAVRKHRNLTGAAEA